MGRIGEHTKNNKILTRGGLGWGQTIVDTLSHDLTNILLASDPSTVNKANQHQPIQAKSACEMKMLLAMVSLSGTIG